MNHDASTTLSAGELTTGGGASGGRGVVEGVLTALLAAFSVGVAVGAVASETLSRGEIGVRVPPIGALGLALMAVLICVSLTP